MKPLLYIIMLLICSSVVFARLDIGLPDTLPVVAINDPDDYPTLGGDNTWTGTNNFTNYTVINYETFNVTGNVTADNFCYDDGTCLGLDTNASTACDDGYYLDGDGTCYNITEKILSNTSGIYVPYINATNNIDVGNYNLTSNKTIQSQKFKLYEATRQNTLTITQKVNDVLGVGLSTGSLAIDTWSEDVTLYVQGWSGGIAYSAIDQDLRHDGAGATFPALTITGSSATQFTALKIRGFTTAIPFLDYEGKDASIAFGVSADDGQGATITTGDGGTSYGGNKGAGGDFTITLGDAGAVGGGTATAGKFNINGASTFGDGGTTNYFGISKIGSLTQYGTATTSLLNTLITGTFNVVGDSTLVNLNVTGNFSAKRAYAMVSSNISEVVTVANTVYIMNFTHLEDEHLMGLEGMQNITFQDSGDYLISISTIIVTDSNNKHFNVFPQIYNGTNWNNVVRSNTKLEIENAGTESIVAVTFMLDIKNEEKFRLMYASDDAGSMTVWTAGSGTGANEIPETPSTIMTISKHSEITD